MTHENLVPGTWSMVTAQPSFEHSYSQFTTFEGVLLKAHGKESLVLILIPFY